MKISKSLFIIGPIGEAGSEVRSAADELRDHIIAPASELAFGADGFVLTRADDIGEPGRITLQILQRLVEADIAIVDLANLNPNVMYELGIRQSLRKPYVILKPVQLDLPFDVRDFRAVSYALTLGGAKEAVKELTAHLLSAGSNERSAVDDLLFGVLPADGAPSESAVQRVMPQVLDELTSIRASVESAVGGVYYLMQREDRERQEQQEYRQQEFGMRMLQTLSENPDGIEKVVETMTKINSLGQTAIESSQILDQQTTPNRAQRRAAKKKGTDA